MPSTVPGHRRIHVRRGVAKTLTLSRHAAALIEELAPSSTSYGAFLSELVVAEAARREERARVREALAAAWGERGDGDR